MPTQEWSCNPSATRCCNGRKISWRRQKMRTQWRRTRRRTRRLSRRCMGCRKRGISTQEITAYPHELLAAANCDRLFINSWHRKCMVLVLVSANQPNKTKPIYNKEEHKNPHATVEEVRILLYMYLAQPDDTVRRDPNDTAQGKAPPIPSPEDPASPQR